MPTNNSKHKPSKRIEYRGKNVRVSRTGGISATKTFKGDGVGATINTKHGLRLHKRLFKETRMGLKTVIFNSLEDIKVVLSISMFPKTDLAPTLKINEVRITYLN